MERYSDAYITGAGCDTLRENLTGEARNPWFSGGPGASLVSGTWRQLPARPLSARFSEYLLELSRDQPQPGPAGGTLLCSAPAVFALISNFLGDKEFVPFPQSTTRFEVPNYVCSLSHPLNYKTLEGWDFF